MIADKIKSIAKINAYENKELLIIFFPILMRSSSPKLNFFIKTPVPTATAAAGVESFKSQLSMFSKAEFILDTNLGSPKANTECPKIKNKMIENKIVNKIKNVIFFNLIIKTPFNNKNIILKIKLYSKNKIK